MGTNFYWHEKPPCKCCGRAFDRIHIGKSSCGWCFSLHVQQHGGEFDEHDGISSLADWERQFSVPGSWIEDEYGETLTVEEMLKCIKERKGGRDKSEGPPWGCPTWESFYTQNSAQPGPEGLLRHRIDGVHCVGHGEGTWDLLVGDFS